MSARGCQTAQSDSAGRAIDCLDRLKRYDELACPEPATPDDHLVRTIGVTLIAHPIDASHLTPPSVDDSVTVGRGQQPSQFAQSAWARAAPLLHARQATLAPQPTPAQRRSLREVRQSTVTLRGCSHRACAVAGPLLEWDAVVRQAAA